MPLVDEVIAVGQREAVQLSRKRTSCVRRRKKISKNIGGLMAQGKKEEAEAFEEQKSHRVQSVLLNWKRKSQNWQKRLQEIMMTIPNIIDPSVPIGKDDSENVEIERFGEPVVPDFEIPYHTEIMEKFRWN